MLNDNKSSPNCQTVVWFSVYTIWCRVTNQYYVGITSQKVKTRIHQHKHGKQFVDREIQRLGWEGNFDYWVVEEGVPSTLITEREQHYVSVFNSVYPNGYNKTRGGIAHFKHSDKTCAQMKTSHRGKKRAPFTDEHRANLSKSLSGENHPNYGKPARNRGVPCPEETKTKIRKKLTGRKRPDQSERMQGENNPNFGKPMAEETKAKLRAKALERDVSGENNPMYGKKRSEETKAIIREKALARNAAKRAVKAAEAAEVAKAAEAAAEAAKAAEVAKAVAEAIAAAKKAANQSATP